MSKARLKTGLSAVDKVLDLVYSRLDRLERSETPGRIFQIGVRGWGQFTAGTLTGNIWAAAAGGNSLFMPIPLYVGESVAEVIVIGSSTGTAARTFSVRESRGTVNAVLADWTVTHRDNTGAANYRAHVLKGNPIPAVADPMFRTLLVEFTAGNAGDRIHSLQVTYV